MKYALLNNFAHTLAGSLAASTPDAEESMTLSGGGDVLGPLITTNTTHALLTIVGLNADNEEIAWEVVEVKAQVSGNEFTVLRGQDGTDAAAWDSGVPVEMRVTTKLMGAFAFTDDLPASPDLSAYLNKTNDIMVLGGGNTTVLDGTDFYDPDAGELDRKLIITPKTHYGTSHDSYNPLPTGDNSRTNPLMSITANSEYKGAYTGYGGVNIGIDNTVKDFGVAVGRSCSAGDDDGGISFGIGNWSYWGCTMTMGAYQYAADFGTSIGMGFMDYDSLGYDEDFGWSASNYEDSGNTYEFGVSLGFCTNAEGAWSIGVGSLADAAAANGLHITAVPYVTGPKSASRFKVEDIGGDPTPWYSQPNATKHSSMQIALALPPINLSETAGTQFDLELGNDLVLFIDSIELVVRDAGDIGGTPAISIGTATGTPADVLAATTISDLTQYSRQIETPLIANGVGNLVAEITTAGSGTAGELYVIIKGYAMEAA